MHNLEYHETLRTLFACVHVSLFFCSSFLSCRGECQKWLFQPSAGDFPEQWEFFIDQLWTVLFCAPSTSVLLHPKGAGHGVSWLSYVQHGRTQIWVILWNTDFVQKSERFKSQFCWNMLWNVWSHGFCRRFLGKRIYTTRQLSCWPSG